MIFFRILKWVLVGLVAIVLIGFIYEQFSRFHFNSKKPEANRFIKINDRDLHFLKKGAGDTTIVFESGIGGDHVHWQELQDELSSRFTTIAYDRAGILWSKKTSDVSLSRYRDDLSHLLETTHCPKPYILVGHSYAGITLRSFIAENIESIAGIVFIDVAHPRQIKEMSDELKAIAVPPPKELVTFLNEIGVLRALYTLTPFSKSVPKNHFFNKNAANYFYKIWPGLLMEIERDDLVMEEAESIKDFKDVPLKIITASYPDGVEFIKDAELAQEYIETHHRLQQDLLNLSTNSKQIMAEKSGHYITLQEPDLIIETIEKLPKNQ